MDEFLASSLPWEIKAAVCLACGLVISVLVLAIPKQTLAWIGKKTPITPNVVTWLRLPIFWWGVWVHFYLSPFWGFELVVFACALDRLDGKMAAAFEEFGVFRSAAAKKIGEWLDPLIDKMTLLPLIGIFAYRGIVVLWVAVAIIVVDVFGTLMRKAVIIWFKKTVEPRIGKLLDSRVAKMVRSVRQAISRRMRKSKASAAGKIKALLQSLALVACMPYEMNWLVNPTVPNFMFDLALFFGVLSVLTRVKIHEDVDKVVDSANSVFSHQDI